MPTFDEVAALVCEQTGHSGPLTEATTLQSDLGVCGVDMFHLIDVYSKRFCVDVSGFLWYFHTCEEGAAFSIGAALFPPPNARVEEIPITVGMLHCFAELRRWELEYPPHQLPRYRLDGWIDLIVVLAIIAIASLLGIRGCRS